MMLEFNAGIVSDVGMIRKNNEDNFLVPQCPVRSPDEKIKLLDAKNVAPRALYAVCDGMGGQNAGEVASYIVANELSTNYSAITTASRSRDDFNQNIKEFVNRTNQIILNEANIHKEYENMGTTLSGLYFVKGRAYFVNVGDSRVYMLRNSKLEQLSSDHSDPMNRNALTRFFGMAAEFGDVEPDVADEGILINGKKRYLLCTDGLTDMLPDDQIETVLLKNKNVSVCANELVENAKKQGGKDNITVIVLDVSPKNPLSALFLKPVTYVVIAALLIGGGLFAYHQRSQPDVKTISLDKIQDISDIRGLKEAMTSCDNEISQISYTVPDIDASVKTVVQLQLTNLTDAIDAFAEQKSAFYSFKDRGDRLDPNVDSGEDVSLLKEELNGIIEHLNQLQDECNRTQKELEAAVKAEEDRLKRMKEEEEARKRAEEEMRRRERGTVSPPPVTSSTPKKTATPATEIPKTTDSTGGSNTSGNSTGGSSTGGNSTGGSGTGGRNAGGSNTGGNSNGGSSTGDNSTDGSSTGGKITTEGGR